jgi:hypothetical protein
MAKSLGYAGAVRSAYEQVFTLASIFNCTLNGKDAALDVSPRSGLAIVKAKDGSDSSCFNWSVVTRVMKEHGGRFVTRDNQAPVKRWAANPLLALV